MTSPRTPQEFLHWLEVGEGAKAVRIVAAVLAAFVLSAVVAWKQFHGPSTESTLIQADMGRQLAAGQGFTTHVNYPQTAAFLAQRGVRFDPAAAYPELHHAPLYPLTIAGGLRLLPSGLRASLFARPPAPPDGFAADYYLLVLNALLFWLAAGLTFDLATKLFDARSGWTAAAAVLVSVPIWQQVVAVNGTALMMVLGLGVFRIWWSVDRCDEDRLPVVGLVGLGAGCALLFLTEYSAGALAVVALAYGFFRYSGARRFRAAELIAAGFVVVSLPWVVRNLEVSGSPVGLAVQNVALKAGDSTAEPASAYATYSADLVKVDLNKLGNKVLSSLQENLRSRLWSGGAMWFAAFFVAGWLYTFRSETVNRLRWVLAGALALLLIAQAGFGAGDSDRWVAVWLSPLIIVFGAGFFFVLLGSHGTFSQWPRLAAVILLGVQALPLVHDALEPRRIHFQYPPYLPALFQGMRRDLEHRRVLDHYGLMADVPAGFAWYSGARVWAQPYRLRDFYAVSSEQVVGELVLTPKTLDRPFFSELNAKAQMPGTLSPIVNRFGEWGEIYAGLLTGLMPADFPLVRPQKVSESLYVLFNPALPPIHR